MFVIRQYKAAVIYDNITIDMYLQWKSNLHLQVVMEYLKER